MRHRSTNTKKTATKFARAFVALVALSSSLDASGVEVVGCPTEFQLWPAGVVETSKGTFLFDATAAASVMAAQARYGNDYAIDYDHGSILGADSRDPSATSKAAGWFNLAIRDGALWAVNVRFTEPARAAICAREWRYFSPVAFFDAQTGRIEEIVNCALTNNPATFNLEPLVAANGFGSQQQNEDTTMTPEQLASLAEVLGLDAGANVEDIIAAVGALAKKLQDAANGTAADEAADASGTEAPPAMDPNAPMGRLDPVPAATSLLASSVAAIRKLTGRRSLAASIVEIERWRKSHVDAETSRAAVAAERAALEGSERRSLVADLVKLGRETPATAWADDTATAPKGVLATMPIAELRDRVASFKASAPAPKGTPFGRQPPTPPPSALGGTGSKTFIVAGKTIELDARELQICADTKCEPETFALLKSRRAPARA